MKKIIGIVLAAILLCGCSGQNQQNNIVNEVTQVVQEGDYAAILPYHESSARMKHAMTSTSLDGSYAIGTGLMEYSKEYFTSDDHTYSEGVFLSYDALDAFEDQQGLLGRTSETNPNGLNPAVGTKIDTDAGVKTISASDVMLLDIHELDWYKHQELAGISIAVILNDEIGDAEQPFKVTDEKLKAYGEESGRKIVSYLRKTYPEIGKKTPIYVTLFKESSYNNKMPGIFIADAYFASGTIGEFSNINEDWAIFPGSKASTLDNLTAVSFERFVEGLSDFSSLNTSIVGMGHFKDAMLDSLSIDISIYAKTWAETNAMIQKITADLELFTSQEIEIKVTLRSDDILIAALKREKGTYDVSVITLAN